MKPLIVTELRLHFCLNVVASRKRRRRKEMILPPELKNLQVTIRENGEIDLGVCREVLMEFLRKCSRDKSDKSSE